MAIRIGNQAILHSPPEQASEASGVHNSNTCNSRPTKPPSRPTKEPSSAANLNQVVVVDEVDVDEHVGTDNNRMVECPILFVEYPAWSFHTCRECGDAASSEAMVTSIASSLNDRLPPTCSISECLHKVTLEELRAIHNTYMVAAIAEGESVGSIAHNDVALLARQMGEVQQAVARQASEAERDHVIRVSGGRRCPGAGCANVVIPAARRPNEKERFACRACHGVGCIGCGEALYHYGCECSAVLSTTRAWHDWISAGLQLHLAQLAATDAEFEGARRRSEAAFSDDTAAAMAAHTQLQADEAYKAAHCKLCPHCNAVVEKIDGCNLMRCGRDTDDGGNQQNGCGERFQFDEAAPYVAHAGAVKLPTPPPELATANPSDGQALHAYANGEPKLCSLCDGVCSGAGPLAECIHCPDFRACIKCQDGLVSGTAEHPGKHVFKLLEAPAKCSRTSFAHILGRCNCSTKPHQVPRQPSRRGARPGSHGSSVHEQRSLQLVAAQHGEVEAYAKGQRRIRQHAEAAAGANARRIALDTFQHEQASREQQARARARGQDADESIQRRLQRLRSSRSAPNVSATQQRRREPHRRLDRAPPLPTQTTPAASATSAARRHPSRRATALLQAPPGAYGWFANVSRSRHAHPNHNSDDGEELEAEVEALLDQFQASEGAAARAGFAPSPPSAAFVTAPASVSSPEVRIATPLGSLHGDSD